MYLQTTVQEESKSVKEDISERFDHLKVRFNVSLKLLICTWIYENWVSKNFVIYLNFPYLSLLTVFFCLCHFVGCFLVRDLHRSGCRGNFVNSHYFYTLPSLPSSLPPPSLTPFLPPPLPPMSSTSSPGLFP